MQPFEAMLIYYGKLYRYEYVLDFKDVKLLKSRGFFPPIYSLILTNVLGTWCCLCSSVEVEKKGCGLSLEVIR